MTLSHLSDASLLNALRAVCAEANALTARIVGYLVEIERRSLHKEAACTSLYDFCTRLLNMSEGAACRRITAARIVQHFPSLLGYLESGALNLTTLELLGPHFTNDNVDELAVAASHKRRRDIELLLAERAPKPDVPAMVYELPPAAAATSVPSFPLVPEKPQTRIAPLSPDRHALQLTITGDTRAKLERAQDLMRHANPTGDLASVIDRALDVLIAKLEKTRLGKTERRRASRGTKTGSISRATRREAFLRDGEQCTFHDAAGVRCPAKTLLELDHRVPRALGGSDALENLRVTCRSHNSLYAERVFGKNHMDRHQRRLPSAAVVRIDPAIIERALRGLVGLGFRDAAARGAMDAITTRHANAPTPPPIEQIVREAIAVLTKPKDARPAPTRRPPS